MSYLDLFQRYGSPSREASVQIRDYLIRPDVLTADRIANYDKSAARTIAECRQLIDQLTEYRQALAERYAQLATASSPYVMPFAFRASRMRSPVVAMITSLRFVFNVVFIITNDFQKSRKIFLTRQNNGGIMEMS